MKFIVCALLMGLGLICCKGKEKKQMTEKNNEVLLVAKLKQENLAVLIKGRWYLNRWTMYHTLDFNEKAVFVDNHIDSVFFLNYSVSNDTLATWSGDFNRKYKNKIINLTKDTFVIEGFAGSADTIRYSHIKREWEN